MSHRDVYVPHSIRHGRSCVVRWLWPRTRISYETARWLQRRLP